MGVPTLSKVIWREGMHLAQHHFQAQNRYFESLVHFVLSRAFGTPYGLVSVEMDQDALWNGTLAAVEASGVMPDGLAFQFPDPDEAPPSRKLAGLPDAGADGHVVHLAIPAYQPKAANCALEAGYAADKRFVITSVALFDETTGDDRRSVEVERKNLQLVLESELSDGLVSLPVARFRADPSGNLVFDEDFVPPCLQIRASRRLTNMLTRLIDMLEAKASQLGARLSGAGSAEREYASHDLANQWLSHAIHASLGPLRHHLEGGRTHPEELFEELSRLAGALCTFTMHSDPSALPLYRHDRLGEVFGALDRHIRDHLNVIVPESFIAVPLAYTQVSSLPAKALEKIPSALHDAYIRSARLEDPRTLGGSEWVLGVRTGAPEAKVIRDVPRLLKVCSAEDVIRLVADSNPGLPMDHLPSPPSAIAPRVGTQYFRLRPEGDIWKLILARSSVGVYVPDAFPDAEVELIVLPRKTG